MVVASFYFSPFLGQKRFANLFSSLNFSFVACEKVVNSLFDSGQPDKRTD